MKGDMKNQSKEDYSGNIDEIFFRLKKTEEKVDFLMKSLQLLSDEIGVHETTPGIHNVRC